MHALTVTSREVRDFALSHHKLGRQISAKDIGWMLLDKLTAQIKATQYGDSARNNLGLRVLENAIEWRLGMLGLDLWKLARQTGKGKGIKVEIRRNGDLYTPDGTKLPY